MINYLSPYNLKSINKISDYLLLIKNIFRIAEYYGAQTKIKGDLFYVRWSINKKKFVIDYGTSKYRDIEGIDLENINLYYKDELKDNMLNLLSILNSDKVYIEFFKKFNLIKNETKFIAFVFNKENRKYFPIGLFQRCESKKRKGVYSKKFKSILINNEYSFLKELSSLHTQFYLEEFYKLKNYARLYENFIIKSKSELVRIKIDNKISDYYLFDMILEDSNITSKNLQTKYYQKILTNNIAYKTYIENKSEIILYYLHNFFVNYLKNILNKKESLIIVDQANNIFYKISEINIIKENKTEDDKILLPLIPFTI